MGGAHSCSSNTDVLKTDDVDNMDRIPGEGARAGGGNDNGRDGCADHDDWGRDWNPTGEEGRDMFGRIAE
jgi:hypothetical protein